MVALAGLVLAAFALRQLAALLVPSVDSPDEIFQFQEQAHRLVYGTGLTPWEFQLGARSWLLPGVIAGLMEFSRLFGDGPDIYVPVIAGACSMVAVIPVVCCFLWCRRWFGLTAAIAGGLAVALDPELVYFGARTLSEVVAAHLLVLGLYLLEPGYRVTSPRRLFGGGATLALVFVLRLQLAPAVVLIAAWGTIGAPRARALAVAGGCFGVLAVIALLDTVTLGYPFASTWRYVVYNAYYGVSSTFGVAPTLAYLLAALGILRFQFTALAVLVLIGARRMLLPVAAALLIVAVHSVVAHKEYRFIYPAIVLLALAAGTGLAAVVAWAERRLRGKARWRVLAGPAAAGLAVGAWCLLSALTWTGPAMAALRYRVHDYLAAASFVAHDGRGLCGIGLYGLDGADWVAYGGYSRFHRPVRMYWPKDRAELNDTARDFDVLLFTTELHPAEPILPAGFSKERCFGKVCMARRAGTCGPAPMPPMPYPEPLAGLVPHR